MRAISFGTRVAYGSGALASGIKNVAFTFFLLFYGNSVLGLPGALTGLCVAIALVVDGITDPLVGSLSDRLRHRWGRRHPFMYASIVPVVVAFALLFSPPDDASHMVVFAWLTTFAVLTRAAMTLHSIPYNALGAELTTDYHLRTSLASYRGIFGALGSALALIIAFSVFFKPSEAYENGQLDPAAYPNLSLTMAILAGISILIAALGTHPSIPNLIQPKTKPERFSLGNLWRDGRHALSNRTFRIFLAGGLPFIITSGIERALFLHVSTYFWKLPTEDIKLLPLAGLLGSLIGAPLANLLTRWVDKKPILLGGSVGFTVLAITPVVCKMAGLYPDSQSPAYLGILMAAVFFSGLCGMAAFVTGGSMIADIADEHELITGRRQEGFFFAALALGGKLAFGLGGLIAGLALQVIDFPTQAEPDTVPADKIFDLAFAYGPLTIVFIITGLVILWRYDLDQGRYRDIRAQLDAHGND